MSASQNQASSVNKFITWLVSYFSRLTTEQSMACIQEVLHTTSAGIFVVIQIATKYSDVLGPVKLIEMFGSFFEARTQRSIYRPQRAQDRSGKSNAFARRATSTIRRKSGISSRRQSSLISFRSSPSVTGSTSFMLSFSSYTTILRHRYFGGTHCIR